MKVVKCTQRGQVTLPKKWRDEVGTDHFLVIVSDEGVTFKPILKKEFVESVEAAWQDYLENGETRLPFIFGCVTWQKLRRIWEAFFAYFLSFGVSKVRSVV